MRKVIFIALMFMIIGAATFFACSSGGDDDDNDTGAAADDDTDDDTADDDTSHWNDDAGDDSGDDDTAATISNFLLMLEDGKLNIAAGGYDYTRCFISASGTMYIEEIGTTTGDPFNGTLTNVGFMQCEIDWSTGIVQILQDGDTGLLDGETLETTIISIPQVAFEPYGTAGKGAKEEAFHLTEFTQCAGTTCVVAGYASISNIFSITEFTNGAYAMNDWVLMWQFSGDTTSGTFYDLTITF